jgi:hypothetical protein
MRYLVNIHGNLSSGKTSTRKVGPNTCHSHVRLTPPVLGSHTRLFKEVFSRAQNELMDVFGMQMIELPKAERVTMRQKRGMSLTLASHYHV